MEVGVVDLCLDADTRGREMDTSEWREKSLSLSEVSWDHVNSFQSCVCPTHLLICSINCWIMNDVNKHLYFCDSLATVSCLLHNMSPVNFLGSCYRWQMNQKPASFRRLWGDTRGKTLTIWTDCRAVRDYRTHSSLFSLTDIHVKVRIWIESRVSWLKSKKTRK